MTISMRAVSGCDRISDEIEVSVLNRKCGLIWFASASTRAVSSSFSCSASRCSMRAWFQIMMGVETENTVASSTSRFWKSMDGDCGCRKKRRPSKRHPSIWRISSSATGASSRITDQSACTLLNMRQMCRCSLVNTNGEKCQISSFGQASRSPPPANPQPTAKGRAMYWPAMSAGAPTSVPTSAPAYGPAMSPARNEPSSVRSAAL